MAIRPETCTSMHAVTGPWLFYSYKYSVLWGSTASHRGCFWTRDLLIAMVILQYNVIVCERTMHYVLPSHMSR